METKCKEGRLSHTRWNKAKEMFMPYKPTARVLQTGWLSCSLDRFKIFRVESVVEDD